MQTRFVFFIFVWRLDSTPRRSFEEKSSRLLSVTDMLLEDDDRGLVATSALVGMFNLNL